MAPGQPLAHFVIAASVLRLTGDFEMTYFEDLSDYCYVNSTEKAKQRTEKNVGWLSSGRAFERLEPSEKFLDSLWSFCTVSVLPTRGLHKCEFCTSEEWFLAERKGKRLLLGSAEIRVFSERDVIYAAPNFIYHYVAEHRYRPPDEFVSAATQGFRPPTREYFETLKRSGYEWDNTYSPDAEWDAAAERLR